MESMTTHVVSQECSSTKAHLITRCYKPSMYMQGFVLLCRRVFFSIHFRFLFERHKGTSSAIWTHASRSWAWNSVILTFRAVTGRGVL